MDLNAIMYRMELNLAAFHTKLRSPEKVIQKYTEAAAARAAAIEELLWNNVSRLPVCRHFARILLPRFSSGHFAVARF